MHQPLNDINKRLFYQQFGLLVIILSFFSICLEVTRAVGTKNDARARWFAGFAKNGYPHLPRSTLYSIFVPHFHLGFCNLLSTSASLYML